MNKLEKSIRHAMNYYGPAIRAGHYGVAGHTTGDMPKAGFLSAVCADVDAGTVKDIRVYVHGDAMERLDYYGESINITEPVERFIKGRVTWDEMISEIATVISEHEEN